MSQGFIFNLYSVAIGQILYESKGIAAPITVSEMSKTFSHPQPVTCRSVWTGRIRILVFNRQDGIELADPFTGYTNADIIRIRILRQKVHNPSRLRFPSFQNGLNHRPAKKYWSLFHNLL